MNREYKIGAYVFQTYEEYSDGLDDVNTIRYIVDNVDMDKRDDRQTSEIRRDHLCHSRSNLFCNLLRNRI